MKRKIAVITVELVDESAESSNEAIKRELSEWFEEDAVTVPWAKEIKNIVVKEE